MKGITTLAVFVLRVPVMLLSIIIGIPFAFIKSTYMGIIEVSDTMIDMVFSVTKIKELQEQENDKNRQGIEL